MPVEGTIPVFLTFLLAMIGYAGLSAVVLMSLSGKLPVGLWRAVAAVIVTHVLMVWHFRYQWEFTLAVRNGYAGFAIFHSAMLMIAISVFCREALARRMVWISFLIVTAGASGAVFRYEAVAHYRYPVLAAGLAGIGGMIACFLQSRRPGKGDSDE